MPGVIPTFPLFVDHRVGSIELAKHIAIPLQVTSLQYADFAFMGFGEDDKVWNFGIERKTIPDLVDSMESGRFSGHQLLGLLRSYHIVYLVLEGKYEVADGDLFIFRTVKGKRSLVPAGGLNRKQRIKYSQVAGFINTLQVIPGIKFWYTQSIKETGAWIRDCYYHWQKNWNDHRSHLQFYNAPPPARPSLDPTPPGLVQRVAKELKGIGWDRAAALAQVFETPEALMCASVKDFGEVPGIGKILAESVWSELHKKNE